MLSKGAVWAIFSGLFVAAAAGTVFLWNWVAYGDVQTRKRFADVGPEIFQPAATPEVSTLHTGAKSSMEPDAEPALPSPHVEIVAKRVDDEESKPEVNRELPRKLPPPDKRATKAKAPEPKVIVSEIAANPQQTSRAPVQKKLPPWQAEPGLDQPMYTPSQPAEPKVAPPDHDTEAQRLAEEDRQALRRAREARMAAQEDRRAMREARRRKRIDIQRTPTRRDVPPRR